MASIDQRRKAVNDIFSSFARIISRGHSLAMQLVMSSIYELAVMSLIHFFVLLFS